jgi:hypothetical protein
VGQSNASTTPMTITIQGLIDRFNANLAKQMKDDYGIEEKNKNLSYRKHILLVLIRFPILLVGVVLNL